MKKIVILNYTLGEVIIDEYDTTLYDAEEYITSVLNLNLVEIEYMSGNDLTIKGNDLTIKGNDLTIKGNNLTIKL